MVANRLAGVFEQSSYIYANQGRLSLRKLPEAAEAADLFNIWKVVSFSHKPR